MRQGLLAVALLGLAACPRRLSFGPQGEIRDAREALQALAARSAKLHRLRAELSFSADGSRGSGSSKGLLAAARPAQLRLELDDFFGNPAAMITSDGTTIGEFRASENLYASGPASAADVGRIVPVDLSVPEAVDLLFGDPRPLGGEVRGFFVDRSRYSYALLFAAGAGTAERRQRIDLDTETLVPVGETVEGHEPFEARFSDFESDSGLRLPLKLEVRSSGGRVSVKYRNLEVNPMLSADLFTPRAPPGSVQQELR